jgi:hypothetical protein
MIGILKDFLVFCGLTVWIIGIVVTVSHAL